MLLWDIAPIGYCESTGVMTVVVVQILNPIFQAHLIFISVAPMRFKDSILRSVWIFPSSFFMQTKSNDRIFLTSHGETCRTDRALRLDFYSNCQEWQIRVKSAWYSCSVSPALMNNKRDVPVIIKLLLLLLYVSPKSLGNQTEIHLIPSFTNWSISALFFCFLQIYLFIRHHDFFPLFS